LSGYEIKNKPQAPVYFAGFPYTIGKFPNAFCGFFHFTPFLWQFGEKAFISYVEKGVFLLLCVWRGAAASHLSRHKHTGTNPVVKG
jgi:hypothetical protein